MVFFFFFASGPVTSSEVPSLRLRDKSISLAWNVQNVSNFLVSFTLPYLLNAGYANLGSKVGFIYGSIGLAGVVWGFFFLPELKGRSLEEIDEMFAEKVPACKTRRTYLLPTHDRPLAASATQQANTTLYRALY